MDQAKHARTPMATNEKLNLDKDGKPISEKVYRGMIGSLLYLTTNRPNIMFSICFVLDFKLPLKNLILHV